MTESPRGQHPIHTGPISMSGDKVASKGTTKKGLEPNEVTPIGFPGPVNLLLITGRSDWGLAPRQVIELLKLIKPIGARVAVAAPSEPPHGNEFRKNASNFISIKRDEFSITDFFRLSRAVKNLDINIIHSHGRIGGLYSRLLGMKTGIPVIHTFHGIAKRDGMMGKIYSIAERLLARTKFIGVFPSDSEYQQALQAGLMQSGQAPLILEKAIDIKAFPKKKKASFGGAKLRIGGIARSGSANGPDLLLKLANETGDIAHWSSSGLNKDHLAKYGHVPEDFEAVTSPAELVSWMQSLDVFVCTSRHEGHANGVLEALAAGVPCVLAQIPAHQDIAGAQAAIVFEPEDTIAFRGIMQNLREDVGLRNSLVSNGTYYLERFHNWDKHVEDTLELYRSGLRGW
ncbi:MAG: glycosyltransferase family 4 protein [Bdellovibrionales bacterium]|nr:glycosyltransferase family 4 protein [Bdellovibrionales bacterium]